MTIKLLPDHKHFLKLIDRDKGADGWCPVGKMIYPVLQKNMPTELVEHRPGEDGLGFARLTLEGENILKAMAWL